MGGRRGSAWALGRVVGGDLELLGVLGQGGVGTVYRARSRAGQREVALKVITGDCTPARRERLRREAALTLSLDHPGIVRLLATGEEEGLPYLVYELIEGRPLEELLRALTRAEGVRLVRDVAAAVGHAHARGIVHRDVKPANVLVDRAGRARVLDFGLGVGPDPTHLTRTGALLGTPHYAAPEQLMSPRDAGPPADVWSLGVILYQVLTGRRPFGGTSLQEILFEVSRATPPPPRALDPSIPPDLERICLRALAPAPAERWPDGTAFARELSGWLGEAARTRPARARGAGLFALAAATLAMLVTAAAIAALLRERPGSPPATSATAAPAPPSTAAVVYPGDPAALHDAVRAMQRGEWETALSLLARAPDDARVAYHRGVCRRGLGDLAGALVELDRSLALEPDSAPALIARGHLHSLRGQAALGVPDLVRATLVAPEDHESWHYLGLALLETGDLAGAERTLSRALELEPRFASSWVNRGSTRARSGDVAGAIADYGEALRLDPDHLNALEWRARVLLLAGRPLEALADIDRLLSRGRDTVEVRLDRATAFVRLGREPAGLPDLDRALALDPSRLDVVLRRGLVRGNADDPRGSLEDIERYLAAGAPHAEAFSGRGVALQALGRDAEAEASYGRALELDPAHLTARNNRALLRLEAGRHAEALDDLDAVLRVRADVAQPHNNRASALLALGRAGEALASAEQALRLLPEYPSALRNRAQARIALGDRGGARTDYLSALALTDPADPLRAQLVSELSGLEVPATR